MAGQIVVSSIKTDSDNSISFLANTGATIFSANLASGLSASSFGNNTITSDKIVSVANTKISGNITNDQILSVANTKITGNITSSQIAPSQTFYGNTSLTGLLDLSATNAGQIKFPATQNASSDANTLDDYEEGTWEPIIRPETGSFTSVTYHPDTGGKYIKIGQLVYLTGSVRWTALNTTGGSGNAYIGDLPFSCASRTNGDNADGCGSAFTPIWNGSGSNVPTLVRMINNSTNLFISTQDGDAVNDNVAVSELGSACFITFTIVMHTS
jgi:hypothetical protein